MGKSGIFSLLFVVLTGVFIPLSAAKKDKDVGSIQNNRPGISKTLSKNLAAMNPCAVKSPAYPGDKIVYCSGVYGEVDIWIMNKDGSGQIRLTSLSAKATMTSGPIRLGSPTLSPDGRKIAFVRYFAEGNPPNMYSAIYVMDINGLNMTLLSMNDKSKDSSPVWSPDGRRILFTSTRGGDSDLYIMNADGSGQTRLTTLPGAENNPVFSPDGSKMIFYRIINGRNELVIAQADGRYQQDTGIEGFNPQWCPTGDKISFSRSSQDNDIQLYIMKSDLTGVTPLTATPGRHLYHDWAPDGSRIVYSYFPPQGAPTGTVSGIYIMSFSGGTKTLIAPAPAVPGAALSAPQW